MGDTGKIVSDQLVSSFVSKITLPIKTSEALIIQACEEVVQAFCKRIFAITQYVDKEYSIRVGEDVYSGMIVRRRRTLHLGQYPVTTFLSLKTVTARSESTGEVSESYTIPRNAFYVNRDTGMITLIGSLLNVSYPSQVMYSDFLAPFATSSFLEGTANILATFTAGYTEATMPKALQLAVLQIIARQYVLMEREGWLLESVTTDFGSTVYKRVTLTPEEELMLTPFKCPKVG